MTDLNKIAIQMREDWNRRINHDYRFWMSESHVTDEEMWQSGRRDSAVLLNGIKDLSSKTFLEIGCGVGRILKSAYEQFGRTIGFDVSESAIKKSRELLGASDKLELYVGDGFTLNPLTDESVDVAVSFAAITSMPVDVMANYLREIHRVLKSDGMLRLQVYLGEEQIVCSDDTLHLRCYKRENFLAAADAAGFDLDWVEELILPFQVSFKEIGIEAFIASFSKGSRAPAPVEVVSQKLLPAGEKKGAEKQTQADIECWMSLNYAKELAERGEYERAKEAVEYASNFSKVTSLDVRDLIDRILDIVEKKKGTSPVKNAPLPTQGGEVLESNLKHLKTLFPSLHDKVNSILSAKSEFETRETAEGPSMFNGTLCLDHPTKPSTAAVAWAKRLLDERRYENAKTIVVYGLGCGYHVEALRGACSKEICVVEPSLEAFATALKSHDLSGVFKAVKVLHVGLDEHWDFFDGDSELALRPQSQSLFPEHSASLKSAFYGKRGLATLHPAIAVIGPMQGGTLPITGYTLRSLVNLGQRTRALELSGFASSFHNLEKLVFDKGRQSQLQGHYVEMISQVVLESLNEKPADIVICMAQAPLSGRALSELRKRGVITVLWFVEDYLRFTYWREMAKYYDFIFTIQKGPCLDAIKGAGAGEVHYLPVACDPVVHAPAELTEEERQRWGSPISFVGAGYHNRQQMFAALCELPFKIWGTEWPLCKPFDRLVQEQGRRLSPEEYIKIFNSTDININLHSSSERDGVEPYGDFVNPRTIELASAGAFQLVDERTHLPEMLEPGKEVATFTDLADLKEKIAYYLAHPEERRKIAEAGRARVLRDHTYDNRLQEMLSIIFSSKYEMLKDRLDRSPWQRMLKRAKPYPELFGRCDSAFQRGEEPNLDGLISDIIQGKGKLSETEQKLLFLFHIRKQIIRAQMEEGKA